MQLLGDAWAKGKSEYQIAWIWPSRHHRSSHLPFFFRVEKENLSDFYTPLSQIREPKAKNGQAEISPYSQTSWQELRTRFQSLYCWTLQLNNTIHLFGQWVFQQLPISTEIHLSSRPYLSWILMIPKTLYSKAQVKKLRIKYWLYLQFPQSAIKYKSNTQETRFWTY